MTLRGTLKNKLTFFILISLLPFAACKDDTADFTRSKDFGKIKFHTKEQEGRWPGKGEDHIPIIKWSKSNANQIIVTVPLEKKSAGRHFIEVIVFMEGDKKEIAKKSFAADENLFQAVFPMPKDYNPEKSYWVIGKCNLHQMWRSKVPAKP